MRPPCARCSDQSSLCWEYGLTRRATNTASYVRLKTPRTPMTPPHGAAVVAGAAPAVASLPYWTLDCVPTVVVVDGTTYYRCDSAWYVRVYSGGEIAYAMVNPPAGY